MKNRYAVLAVCLLILLLAGVLASEPRVTTAQTLDSVYASPINGGCYIAGPNQCKIHLDPFTINMDNISSAPLKQFAIYANGVLIYDFRTDVSNPPYSVDYVPSQVALDFAATCGVTYTINMAARAADNTGLLNAGVIQNVVCPSVMP